jgi:Carbohydrate binding module (family 6)
MSDISASCFTASSGRFSLTKATGDSDPAGVDDIQAARLGAGYYLRFPDINFGAGASQFRVRVASGAAAGVSGSIEVVLDSPTNSPLTVLGVGSTGSWSSWENLAANMTEATGQHTVYLIFSTNFKIPFVSLHYFSFPPT